jgi:restriction endonuclease S subunit
MDGTKFKHTEVGEIPGDWEEGTLGSFCTIKNGKTNSVDAVRDGTYPLFDRSAKVKRSNKYLFEKEAVIIPGEGKDFIPRYYKGRFDLHQRAYAIWSNNDQISMKYVYYWVCKNKDYLSRYSVGSTVKSLRLPILQSFPFAHPSMIEQLAITKILSDIDSRIEILRHQNKTLDTVVKAIYKHWFIDFDFPNKENAPYKSNGGEMIYDEVFEAEIPKDWKIEHLCKVAKFVRGFSYRGSEKSNSSGGFVFVTLNSICEGGGFKREFSYLTSNRLKERHFVEEGDIIIANTHFGVGGSNVARILGTPALVEFPNNYDKKVGCFSHHITKIIPLEENMKHYLYYFLQNNQSHAVKYKKGSFIWALDITGFSENERVVVPASSILGVFSKLMNTIFRKHLLNNKQSATLAAIRDILLPKLLSGKIRVPLTKENLEVP